MKDEKIEEKNKMKKQQHQQQHRTTLYGLMISVRSLSKNGATNFTNKFVFHSHLRPNYPSEENV